MVKSETVAFKSLHYTVVEGNKEVEITVIKRSEGNVLFRLKTSDDTAIAGKDYTEKNEDICMKHSESERKIRIPIVDDEEWEPDKDFFVSLCNSDTEQAQLPGEDTKTKVTIIDNDNPGQLGFAERTIIVRPDDKVCELKLERNEG